MTRTCVHTQDEEVSFLEGHQTCAQQLNNPDHRVLIHPRALLAQDENIVCVFFVEDVRRAQGEDLCIPNDNLRESALYNRIVAHGADESHGRSSRMQTGLVLLFQRFLLCAALINSDSTTRHAWTQSHASLVQIDVHHHLSRGRLILQEVVPLPGGSGLRYVSMVRPRIAQEAKTWAKIAPTFRALLFKENKVMVLFWRPESGHHFWPRTVVSGSPFGGLGVPHFAPSPSRFPGATCPPL